MLTSYRLSAEQFEELVVDCRLCRTVATLAKSGIHFIALLACRSDGGDLLCAQFMPEGAESLPETHALMYSVFAATKLREPVATAVVGDSRFTTYTLEGERYTIVIVERLGTDSYELLAYLPNPVFRR